MFLFQYYVIFCLSIFMFLTVSNVISYYFLGFKSLTIYFYDVFLIACISFMPLINVSAVICFFTLMIKDPQFKPFCKKLKSILD